MLLLSLGPGHVTVISVESTSSTLIQCNAVWVCHSAVHDVVPASEILGRRFPKPTFFYEILCFISIISYVSIQHIDNPAPHPPLTMSSSVILVRRIKNKINSSYLKYLICHFFERHIGHFSSGGRRLEWFFSHLGTWAVSAAMLKCK